MENITVRLSSRNLRQEFTDRLECEPNRRHQETRQCRVWRSTARIRDGESIGGKGPDGSDPASLASKRFQCGGIVAGTAPSTLPIEIGTAPWFLALTRFLPAN